MFEQYLLWGLCSSLSDRINFTCISCSRIMYSLRSILVVADLVIQLCTSSDP